MRNKIGKIGLLAAGLASGCASAPKDPNLEAMSVLGLDHPAQLRVLDGGFRTTRGAELGLQVIAGIYSGSVKVTKEVGRDGSVTYRSEGTMRPYLERDSFQRAYADADVDGDKIITQAEERALASRVHEEYSQ